MISPFSATWRNDVAKLLNGGDESSGALLQSGTWTPTVNTSGTAFTSIIYTTQDGVWAALDLGNGKYLVWAAFVLNFTPTVGPATGTINFNGLQSLWTIAADLARYAGNVSNINNQFTWNANRSMVAAHANQGADTIRLFQLGSAQTAANLTVANLTSGGAHALEASVLFLATKP